MTVRCSWRYKKKPFKAFFVPADQNNPQTKNDGKTSEDLGLVVLANAKHIGLTFADLYDLTMAEVCKLVEMHLGEVKPGTKQATQEDIDRLLG